MYGPAKRQSDGGLTSWESSSKQQPPEFKIVKHLAVFVGGIMLAGSSIALVRGAAQPHNTAKPIAVETAVQTRPPKHRSNSAPTSSITAHSTTTRATIPETTLAKPTTTTTTKPTTTVATSKPSLVRAADVNQPNFNYGVDVSWPEGNCTAPASALAQANFVVVGINHGLPFTDNTNTKGMDCFDMEVQPARQLELYVNVAAPYYASDLTHATSGPKQCQDLTATPVACSYNYGYNAGLYDIDFITKHNKQYAFKRLWLDIEKCDQPCFTSNISANIATIQGEVDGLQAAYRSYGQLMIGFYANKSEWQSITGNQYPDPPRTRQTWIATGPGTPSSASDWVNRQFDGGLPVYAQYIGNAPVADGAGRELCYDLPIG